MKAQFSESRFFVMIGTVYSFFRVGLLGIAIMFGYVNSGTVFAQGELGDEFVESLIQILEIQESDLPSGMLEYAYRMRTSDSFGAFVRAQELSGTMQPGYYDHNTCDADASCELLFWGQDFQLRRTTEFLRWGSFDSHGDFLVNESRKVPPHTSIFTREGDSMMVQRLDSKVATIMNQTTSVGVPLVTYLLRGVIPDYIPARRIHQYDSWGVRSLPDMIELARGDYGDIKLSRTDAGNLLVELQYPDYPQEPEASITMHLSALLDPEKNFLPLEIRGTRRDRVDSGIRYEVDYSDYEMLPTGRTIPKKIAARFAIVPKHYFPNEIQNDKILADHFSFQSEEPVEIVKHEIIIKAVEVPAKHEIEVDLVPGTEIHNRILGTSRVFQGNLEALKEAAAK